MLWKRYSVNFSMHQSLRVLVSVDPETATFSPGRRFRFFAILGIDTLCLSKIPRPFRGGCKNASREPHREIKIYYFRMDTS
jgi:hypothetical protein